MLVLRGGVGHAADERAHCVTGARVHAEPAQRGQRQHRRPSLRVGLDQQVPAVVVAKRKFGQADDEVPFVLASLVLQPPQRGVDVLGTGGERLAHDLDVPGVAILAVRRVEVAHPARDLGGRGRVGHKADVDRLHASNLPTAPAQKPPSVDRPIASGDAGAEHEATTTATREDMAIATTVLELAQSMAMTRDTNRREG